MTTVLAATGTVLTAAPQPAQAALPPQTIADPVHYWNDVQLEIVRREGGGPGQMSRAAAMMNAAVYDAESSYQLKWKGRMTSAAYIHAEQYAGWIEGPDEEEPVIGRTAYNILLSLYPGQTAFLDHRFTERFGSSPKDGDILDLTIVNKMVTQMRNDRNGDGSENPRVYVGDDKPGAWRPTSYPDMNDPGCARHSQAVTPFWGEMKPFALTSGSQFRPPTPGLYGTYEKLLAGDAYKRQVEVVRSAGADKPTARTPVVNRTPDQEGRLVLGQRRGRHLQAARPAPAGHPRHRHRTQAEHLRQRTAVRPRVDRHDGRRHRRQGREVPDSGRPVAACLRHPRRWPRPGMEAPPQEPGRNQFQPLLPGLGLRTRHLRRCLGRGDEALLQQ
ncbi:hypothetical protein [Streptomyces venezuelae]|uniref:hypothetical protein n=1 Tax=Streptomyces venezuelae TaxID=54571 RepID=UPI001CC2371E|nr:hypothetical protein [Streptomyces venezuelae]